METDARETSIGFVSTYPPTVCGLATYTASLLQAIAGSRRSRAGLGVIALGDRPERVAASEVAFHHHNGNASSLEMAVGVLNSYDTVSVSYTHLTLPTN